MPPAPGGTSGVGALGAGSGRGADAALAARRASYVDVTVALNTTRFLSKETAYMPWAAALNNLNYFQLMFDRSEVFGVMTVSGATSPAVAPQRGGGLLPVPPGADPLPPPRNMYRNR